MSQVVQETGGEAKKDNLSVVPCLRDSQSLTAPSAPKVTPL